MFKHHNLNMLGLKKTNTSNFHPLEVVGRGSETNFKWINIPIILSSALRVEPH